MQWELRQAGDIDCTLDASGVYVAIHRVVRTEVHKEHSGQVVRVRADLMTSAGEPIVSFIGTANNVRKHLLTFLALFCWEICTEGHMISHEHASYIGYELLRAETDEHYVQD